MANRKTEFYDDKARSRNKKGTGTRGFDLARTPGFKKNKPKQGGSRPIFLFFQKLPSHRGEDGGEDAYGKMKKIFKVLQWGKRGGSGRVGGNRATQSGKHLRNFGETPGKKTA